MITAIRSAVICERVEVDDDGMINLHRVRGDPLVPENTPGFLHVWVFLLAELDGKRSVGHVRVVAAEFAPPVVPFDLPGGLCVSAMAFLMLIPVVRSGALKISIVDRERGGKPLRIQWGMELDPDAPPLDEAAGRGFVKLGVASAEIITAAVRARRSRTH
jgi:hypothetical protein